MPMVLLLSRLLIPVHIQIGDYLYCSVVYLLCRTENPYSHSTHVEDIVLNSRDDQQLIELCKIYDKLDVVGKTKLVAYANELKIQIQWIINNEKIIIFFAAVSLTLTEDSESAPLNSKTK